jgi:N-acetylglucosaminyl-diphospho-decaprenol L-rhamnosyltransferase
MQIAVGLVVYQNPREELLRARRSIARAWQHDGDPDVSWRSHTPTPELWLAEFGPRVWWAPENPGFGAGHNALMAAAFERGVDAYLCMNPDAVLHRDCLAEMTRVAMQPGVGLVEARLFPEEHPKPYDWITGETPWCAATVLLVTRQLFEKVGGFDERFFMYCEDVDLSWRARASGFSVRVAHRALAFHYVEERPLDEKREQAVHRSAVLLGQKYNCKPFIRLHRRAFLEEGGTPTALPTALREPLPGGVADFRHGLRFARSRW